MPKVNSPLRVERVRCLKTVTWQPRVVFTKTWLDVIGSFHSDQATVVERFTPLDANTMRWTGTVTDPTVFTRPWTMGWNYVRSETPGQGQGQGAQGEIWEYGCAEGNRFQAWDDIYARELAPK